MKPKPRRKTYKNNFTIPLALTVSFTLIMVILAVSSAGLGKSSLIKNRQSDDSQTKPSNKAQAQLEKEAIQREGKETRSKTTEQDSESSNKSDTIINTDNKEEDAGAGQSSSSAQSIMCGVVGGRSCLIVATGVLAGKLDANPFVSGAMIGGQNVPVEQITHSLVFGVQSENKISDVSGKTLASSTISYDTEKKELIINIGADKVYYEKLTPAEQKTLYTSQLIRAIFSVTGEVPSNYPKVASTVNKLANWDPNTDQ